jgi:hypothetical protein
MPTKQGQLVIIDALTNQENREAFFSHQFHEEKSKPIVYPSSRCHALGVFKFSTSMRSIFNA